jgi:hypothetical protein
VEAGGPPFALALPLHARYPAPCSGPPLVDRVRLPPPRLLVRCGGEWVEAGEAAGEALEWLVPCGDAQVGGGAHRSCHARRHARVRRGRAGRLRRAGEARRCLTPFDLYLLLW